MDGVLYVGDQAIPGAPQAVAALREAGFALRFVTNTTARSRARLLELLEQLGFEVAASELVTPTRLAADYCREHGHRAVALLAPDELHAEFAGLPIAAGPDDARRRGGRVPASEGSGPAIDAIVLGDLGEGFDYALLNGAFRWITDGAQLIALQRNRSWRRDDGLALDLGPFVAALEYATRRQAVVVGKPSPHFFELVLADLGLPPERCVMVGDDAETDVAGAQACGIRGVFVRSGKHTDADLCELGVRPDLTLDSIADLPSMLSIRR